MTRRARRDFLLDSGGISALARDRDLLVAYLRMVEARFDGALLVPVPVLTEVRTGRPAVDTLTDRLLKAIGASGDMYLPLSVAAATRAGVLRTQALELHSSRVISAIDAQIVALAEERSNRHAVTIVTGDARDIDLLVDLTRRTNIAVDVVR